MTHARAIRAAMSEEIDALGLLCPLPVLRLRKRLQAIAPGQSLTILTDDPVAVIDVPHFCQEAGHRVVSTELLGPDGPARRFTVLKGAD
ncbi:sulfurtransferase TusA family protein [Pseudooceanicola sp.]|jgi:tRNA 2-thiouridine synthesizing protein A|uniref:sulfurtransferase TusA family protein n=1 Tax=Pseudooceanicola sp. TaxID=1914328 RepID=UPI004059CAB7